MRLSGSRGRGWRGPGQSLYSEPIGQVEDDPDRTEQKSKGIPSMACRSREPLRVVGEVAKRPLYHGTRADLKRET